MKKNMFIMSFLILTLSVFIPSVSASDITKNGITYNENFYFPAYEDFTCGSGAEETCLIAEIEDRWSYNYNYQCWYMFTQGQSEVVCYVSSNSWVPYLHWRNGQGVNQYNPDGFYIDGYSWINSNNTNNYYKSIGIFRWNSQSYGWDTVCWAGNNSCQYFPGDYYIFPMAFYSSVPSNRMTPIFHTDIWYTSDRWNAPFFQGFNLNSRPISNVELIITEESSGNSARKNLFITLYDPDSEFGNFGKVQYSYDNTNWEDTTLEENGQTYTLPVYTNGIIYFRILDSNNSEIYTDTYNVTGLPTITGYQIYKIPSGNHNIYISNFGNITTGTIYVPPGYGNLTDNFIYLDSNGEVTGIQQISYLSYEDNIWVPSIPSSEPSSTLVGLSYDFTNFQNTKVLSFNFNNDKQLVLYIPNGLYLDYVDLSDKNNYNCAEDTNISGSVNLQNCYVEYDWKDNGTLDDESDKSNNRMDLNGYQDGTLSSEDYFSDIKKVIDYNKPLIVGVTQDFTTFFNHLATPIKMSFFFCFGVLFVVLIVKSFKY